MQEIKFRCYDTIRKQMEPMFEKHVAAEDGTEFVMLAFRFIGAKDWSTEIVTLATALAHPKRYIVMQSTGLKDTDGYDIYDRDIVRLWCSTEEFCERNKMTATIVWENAGFHVRVHDKEIKVKGGSHAGKMISMQEVHMWTGMHSDLYDGQLEIIGNTCENKDLLI